MTEHKDIGDNYLLGKIIISDKGLKYWSQFKLGLSSLNMFYIEVSVLFCFSYLDSILGANCYFQVHQFHIMGWDVSQKRDENYIAVQKSL